MYWPAEGFTYVRRLTAGLACKADLFCFPFPMDSIQCLQMNESDRSACGFKNSPNQIYFYIQDVTNCYPVSHLFIRLRNSSALLALNVQCLWLCCWKAWLYISQRHAEKQEACLLEWSLWSFISKRLIYSSISHYKYLAVSLCHGALGGQRRPTEEFRECGPQRTVRLRSLSSLSVDMASCLQGNLNSDSHGSKDTA